MWKWQTFSFGPATKSIWNSGRCEFLWIFAFWTKLTATLLKLKNKSIIEVSVKYTSLISKHRRISISCEWADFGPYQYSFIMLRIITQNVQLPTFEKCMLDFFQNFCSPCAAKVGNLVLMRLIKTRGGWSSYRLKLKSY